MFRKEKGATLRSNLEYLLRSKGETQVSLSQGTGLNRTTIFNILEGRVTSIQKQTLRKISDFFGVTMYQLQNIDIAAEEKINATILVYGNMNAATVPIIPLTSLSEQIYSGRPIGEMILSWPTTYYYGQGPNLIAVLMDGNPPKRYKESDLIIIRKGIYESTNLKLLFHAGKGYFTDVLTNINELEIGCTVLGDILEERYASI